MQRTQTFVTLFAYLLGAALLIALHLTLVNFAADDALIHLRIARHLLVEGQPFFNPGVGVMTSTSPAWILLLAALFALFGAAPAVVSVLNAICSIAAVWFFARLVSPRPGRIDLLIAAVVLCFLIEPSITLMETPFALALLAGSLTLVCSGRPIGFLPLAIGVFVRPELAVFLVFSLLAVALKNPRLTIRSLLWAVAGAFPLLCLQFSWFDSPIPQAFRAKAVIYNPGWAGFLDLLLLSFYGPLIYLRTSFLAALHLGLVIGLIVWVRKDLIRHCGSIPNLLQLSLLFPAVVVLLAYGVKQVYLFPWYAPLYSVPLGIGALLLASRSIRLRIAALLVLAPPLFTLGLDLASGVFGSRWFSGGFYEARVASYRQIGRALQLQHPEATVLAAEIGGLGFEFHGPIMDSAGLASPELLKFYQPGQSNGLLADIPPQMVQELMPDFIVVSEVLGARLLHSPESGSYVWEQLPIATSALNLRGLGGNFVMVGTRREIFREPLLPPHS